MKEESNEKKQDESKEEHAQEEKDLDLSNFHDVFNLFKLELKDDEIKEEIKKYLSNLKEKYQFSQYKVLFLFDEFSSISSYETDKIYEKVKDEANKKDILLILNSYGGRGEPSYLLSKTLKKLAKNKFIIAIPRRAKSAATLISLGADEIHMGLMSELGPIDLQVGGYPALGLGNSLDYIAKIVTKYPKSYEMFASYLTKKMDLIHLGYLERLGESTVQYGERLIGDKKLPEEMTPSIIARKLVYDYKDHNFVIDIDEAKMLLGDKVIKENTAEYKFANEIYTVFDVISKLFEIVRNKEFSYVGDIESGFNIKDKKEC